MNMSLVLRLSREMHFCRFSSNAPRLPTLLGNCYKTLTLCSLLAGCTFSTSQLPKVARACGVLSMFTSKCASCHNGVHFFNISILKVLQSWGALYILTSKCASRHNGVHFVDISTSKSAPKLMCFVHVYFETCSAPQQRAIVYFSSL